MSDTSDEPDDSKMSQREFISANFFSPTADDEADELVALGAFVRSLDAMAPPARRAAIAWLADRYLGVRIR